jgi:putative sterol carrier protein
VRGPLAAAPYLSAAWVERARRRVEEATRDPQLVGPVSLSVLSVVTDRPGLDAEAVYIRFARGHLEEVTHGSRKDFEQRHAEADFRLSATYETFAAIHRGELGERKAVLSGRVRVHGPLLKALRLLKAVEALNAILRLESATYDD